MLIQATLLAAALSFGWAGSSALAQGLVRLSAGSPETLSLLAAADDRPVRLVVALKTQQSFSTLSADLASLRSAVADAQSRTRQSLSWLTNQVSTRYQFIPAVSLTANRAQIEDLLRADQVAAVYEEQSFALLLDDSGPMIGKPAAQALNARGAGQVVAVLDTGFDVDHPYLAGRIVAEACFSQPGTAANPNEKGHFSNCPGGTARETGPGSSRFHADPGYYGLYHGTHVAGIVAGKGDSFGGVAPDAGLILANVYYRRPRSQCPKNFHKSYVGCMLAWPSDILSALEWVFKQRRTFSIAAVNMSFGGGSSKKPCEEDNPFAQMFRLVRSVDITIVAAAGNNGEKDEILFPACLPSAISVGATTPDDKVAMWSSSASFLDVLAPGVKIISSVPGGKFRAISGTTVATPQVAGAMAVLRSARPSASVADMLKVLIDTGVPITDTNGITKSRIQIDKAVAALKARDAASNTSPTPKPKDSVTNVGGITVRKSPAGKLSSKKGNKAINADGSIKW